MLNTSAQGFHFLTHILERRSTGFVVAILHYPRARTNKLVTGVLYARPHTCGGGFRIQEQSMRKNLSLVTLKMQDKMDAEKNKFRWLIISCEPESHFYQDVVACSKNFYENPYDCLNDFKKCAIVFPNKFPTQLVIHETYKPGGLGEFEEIVSPSLYFKAGLTFRFDPKKNTGIAFWPTTCTKFETIKECFEDLRRFERDDFKTQPDALLSACIFVYDSFK